MSVFCALIIVLQSALNIEGCWLAVLSNYAISSNDLLEVVHGPFGGRAALCASSPLRRTTTRKRGARRDQVTVCPCAPTPPTSVSPLKPNDKQMWRIKTRCVSHGGDASEEQLCRDSRDGPTVLLLPARPAWTKPLRSPFPSSGAHEQRWFWHRRCGRTRQIRW